MAMADKYEELLRAFARHVGLDPEAFAKTQELEVDGLTVGLSMDGNEDFADLVFFCEVGAPAPHRAAEVYKTLLEANYLWAGTGGATLGLGQDSGQALIAGRIDLQGLEAEGLAALVEGFTDTALFWKKYIADEIPLTGAGAGPEAGMSFAIRG